MKTLKLLSITALELTALAGIGFILFQGIFAR